MKRNITSFRTTVFVKPKSDTLVHLRNEINLFHTGSINCNTVVDGKIVPKELPPAVEEKLHEAHWWLNTGSLLEAEVEFDLSTGQVIGIELC